MRQRPELDELASQAHALQQQAASERAKKGPQVQIQGGYLYQEDRYIDPNGVAGVLLGVQWNAIDMGRAGNQAEALSEKAESAMRMRRNAESLIALEVRQRWLELETARQHVQVALSGHCPGRRELARHPRSISGASWHEHRSSRRRNPSRASVYEPFRQLVSGRAGRTAVAAGGRLAVTPPGCPYWPASAFAFPSNSGAGKSPSQRLQPLNSQFCTLNSRAASERMDVAHAIDRRHWRK